MKANFRNHEQSEQIWVVTWPRRHHHYLSDLGFARANSHTKSLPRGVFEGTVDQRASLLAGMWDTDGTIAGGVDKRGYMSRAVRYYTVSDQLAEDTIFLLNSLNFYPYKRRMKNGADGIWRIQIPGKEILRFQEMIPLHGKKAEKLAELVQLRKKSFDYFA